MIIPQVLPVGPECQLHDELRQGLLPSLHVGKALIGVYLVRSTVASAYGAAASLVILLVWVYYSAQVLLTRRRGHARVRQ